jgi:murein L,D-transpeptidase YafK
MHNRVRQLLFTTLFILFCSTLYGSDTDLLTDYRNKGIQQIQKELDSKLAKEDYWNNYLKNIDTSFGYFESYTNILTCDKSKSQLSLYTKDSNNSYKLDKEYSAYTGKNKGDKQAEGDLRTPVGVYNIVKKITKVDSFYGPLAFVTSYPNIYDKYRGKTGQGIWIHGFPIKQERDEYTKGCIAINNKSLECLNKNIDISKTLLIIDEKSVNKNTSKKKLSKVLANLFAWRYSWIYNDIDSYLNFYSPKFKRFDGMNYKQFTKYKTRIFNKNEKKSIIFNNINVIPYPDTKDIFKIAFKEKYKSNSFSFTGNKVLIVKLSANKFNIITEQ